MRGGKPHAEEFSRLYLKKVGNFSLKLGDFCRKPPSIKISNSAFEKLTNTALSLLVCVQLDLTLYKCVQPKTVRNFAHTLEKQYGSKLLS